MTYDGPKTLSSAMRGAPKRDKNGRHLTVIQRLVGKYGIEEGSKIYRHFGVKQKKASRKGTKVRGTKSGPRRYSEGKVGGHGRSQIYQKGDRTGSWTKSGGSTPRHANTGKAWSQERGDGTPVGGPLPKTKIRKACEFLSWKSIYNPYPTAPKERSMIALSTRLDFLDI